MCGKPRHIGLDFATDVGDLLSTPQGALPEYQKDYWAFAHEIRPGDRVLIIAHHFPFALATVDGPSNFVREAVPELGVWFRHFRKVKGVRYYVDFVTNAKAWGSITMTDTISPLRDRNSVSYKLIES